MQSDVECGEGGAGVDASDDAVGEIGDCLDFAVPVFANVSCGGDEDDDVGDDDVANG